ncbi:MAG: hypothetical protein RJA44_2305, partial [Pseudomonadota bacterium]
MLHRRAFRNGSDSSVAAVLQAGLRLVAALLLVWAGASLARQLPLDAVPALLLGLAALPLLWLERRLRLPHDHRPAPEAVCATSTAETPVAAPAAPPSAEPAPLPAAPPPEPSPPPRDEAQAQLTYTISHDLRAPIRVIEGFARIVREDYGDRLDRIGNDHLDRILGAATRMNQMIDAILALSRLSHQPIERQPVDLSQMARQVLDELQQQQPQRQLDASIAPDLRVQGDATLLRMLLDNLIGNAWKYSARGS